VVALLAVLETEGGADVFAACFAFFACFSVAGCCGASRRRSFGIVADPWRGVTDGRMSALSSIRKVKVRLRFSLSRSLLAWNRRQNIISGRRQGRRPLLASYKPSSSWRSYHHQHGRIIITITIIIGTLVRSHRWPRRRPRRRCPLVASGAPGAPWHRCRRCTR